MIEQTQAIILKTGPYAETSLIVQVFTERFGHQSLLVNGVRKPKARFPISLFQPLNLVELFLYYKADGGLQRISQINHNPIYTTIPYDIIKSSIVLFLDDVCTKCLRATGEDPELFAFLYNALQWLDLQRDSVSNYHLLFLLKLSAYLGFCPKTSTDASAEYFDLRSGLFSAHRPEHHQILLPPPSNYLNRLLQTSFEQLAELKMPLEIRRELLNALVGYYALHVDGFGHLKSLEVLEEVMS